MSNAPPVVESQIADLPAAPLLDALARLHELVLLVDEDGRIVWVSGALDAWARRSECLIGSHVAELFGSPSRHEALRERVIHDGGFANERIEALRGDGVALPVELSVVRVSVGSDARPGLLAVVRPVEGDPPARVESAPPAGYFRAILDSSPEAVLAVDRRGYVTYANAAFEALLRQPAADLLDKPVTLVFSRCSALGAIASVVAPGAEDRRLERELELEGADGEARVVDVSTSPLRLADGTHAGTVVFLRDVTQERRFEQAVADKNEELEHYVHAVSHDLRTPLVSLLGFSRLLDQDYGDVLGETGRHFLERIEQAGRTMEGLTNDLLELSRIGRADGRAEPTDALPILRQLAHELKPRLDAAGIELRMPHAPPPVLCVRTQLYQVFANLIGNAIEHMGGAAEPRIEVGVAERSGRHLLWVRDNGVGIPPEERERVFEVFYTARRRPGQRRGTGIGLAVVKKIAETHGGRAWVESEPGKGAAFFVELPPPASS